MRKPKQVTLERRVRKVHPLAILMDDGYGEFYISDNQENLNVTYMIPHSDSEYDAWLRMWECTRTAQNIRRTDPLKAIFYENAEIRKDRISQRLQKTK